ncbi:MAG: molybdopterin-guanine dinucleotide biosynthesis protein B [Planctomycetota bacterium]|nr:molybdopterin-guanine dinucleotide biosynthesis protein B [Planctomycetota bacterium]
MFVDLPVFGVFGASGSGKTTLIEALLARLHARGLGVAVAKIHAHGIEVDRPGKDSDRFFRAGADSYLEGPDEAFLRTHLAGRDPAARLRDLARRCDLVLVEGRKRIACDKLWLLGEGEAEPPPEAGDVVAALGRTGDRAEKAWTLLNEWLARRWLGTPVYGGVLIGGKSARMGRPKHLMESGGKTWLERAVHVVRGGAERVVIVGAGDVPAALGGIARLPDVPDAEGPMAGLLAAMRWAPHASWLVSACDLPALTEGALKWLLSSRAPGVWATLPRLPGGAGVEPLLAHYDFRAGPLLENLAAEGRYSLSLLAEHPKVASPAPPAEFATAWENVNTPDDLARRRIV